MNATAILTGIGPRPEGSSPRRAAPATERLFREHAPRVYRLAWRLLHSKADADDVTQEVFLQVLRKLSTFRGESSLSTWLYRVTVNAALAYRRRRAVRDERQFPETPADFDGDGRALVRCREAGPEQAALDRELREQIDKGIARLPDNYRRVFVLSDVEGLPSADVANALGLSESAVKSRLHRARQRMRKALTAYVGGRAA